MAIRAEADAERGRKEAVAGRLTAEAQLLLDQEPDQLELSTLLALEGAIRRPSLESDQALRRATSLLTQRETVVIEEDGLVNAMALSEDGKLMVVATDTGIGVWDIEQQSKKVFVPFGLTSIGTGTGLLKLSPDGRFVNTVSYDAVGRSWDLLTGKEVIPPGVKDFERIVEFSPAGGLLAHSEESGVYLRELPSMTSIAVLPAASRALAFSPDGERLAVSEGGEVVELWSVLNPAPLFRLNVGCFFGLARFSPDGAFLALGCDDATVRLWDLSSRLEVARMTHNSSVGLLSFTADGRYLVTATSEPFTDLSPFGDETVWTWSLDHQPFHAPGQLIERLYFPRGASRPALSPDGRYLAVREANVTRVWDVSSMEEVKRIPYSADASVAGIVASAGRPSVTFLSNGKLAASTSKRITISDLASDRVLSSMNAASLSLSPNGHRAMSSDSATDPLLPGTARIWELPAWIETGRAAHQREVSLVALSDIYAASSTLGGDVLLTDAVTGAPLKRWQVPGLKAMTFSPDGEELYTVGRKAQVWSTPEGDLVRDLIDLPPVVGAVDVSPDGRLLAIEAGNSVDFQTSRKDIFAILLDLKSGVEIARYAHSGMSHEVAFDPRGRYLAVAAVDHSVGLLSLPDGVEVTRLADPEGSISETTKVAFSRDGRYLAAATGRRTQLWDLDSMQRVAQMALPAEISDLDFSPDGRFLFALAKDGGHIWPLGEALLEQACARLGRNLTHEEWTDHIRGEKYRETC